MPPPERLQSSGVQRLGPVGVREEIAERNTRVPPSTISGSRLAGCMFIQRSSDSVAPGCGFGRGSADRARKRAPGLASIALDTAGSAQVGTKFGTKDIDKSRSLAR